MPPTAKICIYMINWLKLITIYGISKIVCRMYKVNHIQFETSCCHNREDCYYSCELLSIIMLSQQRVYLMKLKLFDPIVNDILTYTRMYTQYYNLSSINRLKFISIFILLIPMEKSFTPTYSYNSIIIPNGTLRWSQENLIYVKVASNTVICFVRDVNRISKMSNIHPRFT